MNATVVKHRKPTGPAVAVRPEVAVTEAIVTAEVVAAIAVRSVGAVVVAPEDKTEVDTVVEIEEDETTVVVAAATVVVRCVETKGTTETINGNAHTSVCVRERNVEERRIRRRYIANWDRISQAAFTQKNDVNLSLSICLLFKGSRKTRRRVACDRKQCRVEFVKTAI